MQIAIKIYFQLTFLILCIEYDTPCEESESPTIPFHHVHCFLSGMTQFCTWVHFSAFGNVHGKHVGRSRLIARQLDSQFFLVSPRDHFVCPVPSFFQNERNWMKKSARVSEKLVSPGLPGLQVATHLIGHTFPRINFGSPRLLC